MPGIDGIELAGELFKSYPYIKIVFVSAFSDFQYARQAIKYKVVDYISKPILRDEVEELLCRIYHDLEKKSSNTVSKFVMEREKLLQRLLRSLVLDIEFFKEELAEVEIVYQALYSKCAVAGFEIMGMERSLAEEWNNDKDKMCEAITNVICKDTNKYYIVKVNFSDNILTVLYVSKKDTPPLQKYTDTAIDELLTRYRLIGINEYFLTYDSLNDFKEKLYAAKTNELKYLKSKIVATSDAELVQDIEKYVDTYYALDISIKTIAERYHFSEKHMGKIFKKIKNKSFLII